MFMKSINVIIKVLHTALRGLIKAFDVFVLEKYLYLKLYRLK